MQKSKTIRRRGRPTTQGSVGRQAIIAAARDALRTKAPGEITLYEIAKIAGVDPALIRYYFGQLQELFTEAAIEITRELRGRLASLNAVTGSPQEKLRQRVLTYLEVFRTNPYYHRLIVETIQMSSRDNRQTVLWLLRKSVEELDDLVRAGARSGELKHLDATLLQFMIVAMCEFLFSARPIFEATFGRRLDDAKFVDHYSRFILALVSDGPDPRSALNGARTPRGSRARKQQADRRPAIP